MEEQYINIDNSFNNTFTSIVNKYLPKIKEVKVKEIDHWMIDDKEIKPKNKRITERQDYTSQLLTLINSEQKRLNKKEYDYKYFAFKISHIPTKDLFHCIKNYKNNSNFFWSIKAQVDKIK